MVLENSEPPGRSEGKGSLDFNIFYISEKDSPKLMFEENMQLVNDDGVVIDEVTISVEPDDNNGFEVFQYSLDDQMLRVRSHVTRTLETLSEVRQVKLPDTEKMLRVTNLPGKYRIFSVETDLAKWTGSRVNNELPKSKKRSLVLEGANVLLLRKMSLSRNYGDFTVLTVDNNGEVCDAHYTVEFVSYGEVKVTRTVGSETMTTVLSFHGRILHHRWSDSQWRLQSGMPARRKTHSTDPEVDVDLLALQEDVPEPEPEVDLPAYWQKKEEVLQELSKYLVEHSGVEDMLADLMKNILFDKPDDPVDYADKFLSEFVGITRDFEAENGDDETCTSDCLYPNSCCDT